MQSDRQQQQQQHYISNTQIIYEAQIQQSRDFVTSVLQISQQADAN
jgi:hypothetical protein